MATKPKRVVIYARVSTDEQTTQNQIAELTTWAKRAGHEVVRVFEDAGISGAKGRDKRPGFDALLKAAVRREFEIVAVWSSDRLGRSIAHLVEVLQTIRDAGLGLYIHTQALDTTTPAGRALFQMLGVFAEFERELIVARTRSGLDRVRGEIEAKGKHVSKSGRTIDRLGRPSAPDAKLEKARRLLDAGHGIRSVAKTVGLGNGTVHKIARELRA